MDYMLTMGVIGQSVCGFVLSIPYILFLGKLRDMM